MASVHGINEALAEVRGMPLATIEAYSRVLRREGVLPKTRRGGGGPAPTTTMAGYMLAAIMRGSPINAAENAREVGDLIVHSERTFEPVLNRQIAALGWPADMSFARAIGWLIDRYVDGTIKNFVEERHGLKVVVDRYWTTASLHWHPTLPIVEEYVAGFLEANLPTPERNLNGGLQRPMEIGFHSPLLHEIKISYGVNKKRLDEAHRKFGELRKRSKNFDREGSETVNQRTLIAIAEVFK